MSIKQSGCVCKGERWDIIPSVQPIRNELQRWNHKSYTHMYDIYRFCVKYKGLQDETESWGNYNLISGYNLSWDYINSC